MDVKELYETNKEFKTYVDKYAEHYNGVKGISIEEALRHELVKNVALFYYHGTNTASENPVV